MDVLKLEGFIFIEQRYAEAFQRVSSTYTPVQIFLLGCYLTQLFPMTDHFSPERFENITKSHEYHTFLIIFFKRYVAYFIFSLSQCFCVSSNLLLFCLDQCSFCFFHCRLWAVFFCHLYFFSLGLKNYIDVIEAQNKNHSIKYFGIV